MAAKKSKLQPETIAIETTQLKINVKTTGDLITKDYDLIPFHPNMADLRDLSNNSYILFPSFIKITMKDLNKAGVGNDLPKVFMNLDKYIKLIKYVTSPDREEDFTLIIDKTQVKNYTVALAQNTMTDLLSDDTTAVLAIQKYEPLTEEEIIVNNIELIKSLFLSVGSHFFILGNDYVIGQSKYVPPYQASTEKNQILKQETDKIIPLAYIVTFELQLLDAVNNPDAGDFSKMTCKAKKGNIAKDMKDIFGTNFGYVPEKRSSIPSILNTSKATQNRQFSKLQKEWEERNKYVKAPTNERERLALEKSWTPLQRKMADYDKAQVDYNKIPPLWLKEKKELDNKYGDLQKELVKYWQEKRDIKESNQKNLTDTFVVDLLNGVNTKINTAAVQLRIENKEPLTEDQIKANRAAADTVNPGEFEELRQKQKEYTELKADKPKTVEQMTKYETELNELAAALVQLDAVNSLIKDLDRATTKADAEKAILLSKFYTGEKEQEQISIDNKYAKPLLEGTGIEAKEIDLKVLKKQEATLVERIQALTLSENPSDTYQIASVKNDLVKLQSDIRKKAADIETIKKKYDIKTIVEKWKKAFKEMERLAKTIDTEKSKDAKKIQNETVNKELDEKLKEIRELKKTLLLAKFFAGNYEDLSKSEKDKNEKKTGKDRPLDSVETLTENLETAKLRYLDVAARISPFDKVQAQITLLNDDLTAIKALKDAKKKERDDKETDIKKKNTDKLTINRNAEAAKRDLTPDDEQRLKTYDADIAIIQTYMNDKIIPIFEKAEERRKLYEKYIDVLKKIGQNDTDIEGVIKQNKEAFDMFNGDGGELVKLIEAKKKLRLENQQAIAPLTEAINTEQDALQKLIKQKNNELKSSSAVEKDQEVIDKRLLIKTKTAELAVINKKLEEDITQLNKNYQDELERKFKGQSGGRMLKRTRKRKNRSKKTSRYRFKKNKIIKKSGRGGKRKKYTLRRLR